jgi:hypothetical protein
MFGSYLEESEIKATVCVHMLEEGFKDGQD